MKKVMLSQPMAGRTDEEIVTTREKAIKALEKKGYEIVNTLSQMSGIEKKKWKSVALCRYRCAFWQSPLKI